jgi:hypothetical protein
MKTTILGALVISQLASVACQRATRRETLRGSAWIESGAVARGHIKPGDIAQFGCPPGWVGVEDTAAALRGATVSAIYVGSDPPPREGTLTCVAQQEFTVPARRTSPDPVRDPRERPLAPVWVTMAPDRTTIGFRSELPLSAAIFIGRETPCGPRLIGVRLGDLLKWLTDPQSATTRDFLGMISAGCPEKEGR